MADQALVHVTGTYTRADGSAETGRVVIRPLTHASMTGPPGSQTIARVVTKLSDIGVLSVHVRASDDPAWMMDGPIPYKIEENMSGSRRSYCTFIYGPGPVDVAEMERWTSLEVPIPQQVYGPARRTERG